MIEEGEFKVTVTLTIVIAFSPIERPTPLTAQDAIDNARSTMSDDFWGALEDECWGVKFEAERMS